MEVTLFELMLVFVKIGAAAYGGGWTIVGVIKASVVDAGWLSAEAFGDLVAIAQLTPGPIALNAATMVGYRLHGLPGAFLATLSVVSIPLAVSFAAAVVAHARFKDAGKLKEALKTGTIGLIAMTTWGFAPQAAGSWQALVLSLAAFFAAAFTKINPLWLILGAGVLGALSRIIFA